MSTMFRALHVAVDANNLGVSLLRRYQPGPALDILRGAAEIMYALTKDLRKELFVRSGGIDLQAFECEGQQKQTSSYVTKVPEVVAKMREIFLSETYTGIRAVGQSRKQWQAENDIFLHKEGLCLSPPTTPTTCVLESSTVLFNMALAHHMGSSVSSECVELQNALTLYDMAAAIAFKLEERSASQTIVMASLNNMGHIYHQVGKYRTSRDYLDDLSYYIMSLDAPVFFSEDPTNSPNALPPILPSGELHSAEKMRKMQFLLNASFLHEPRGAPAA